MATQKSIRESLELQLAQKGAGLDCFTDLVKDYISLWKIKNRLLADIRKRGIVYKDRSSTGVLMQKNNPSVKELLGVNRQMLSILKELGLTTNTAGDDQKDEL
jgi:phage terminase small subunit